MQSMCSPLRSPKSDFLLFPGWFIPMLHFPITSKSPVERIPLIFRKFLSLALSFPNSSPDLRGEKVHHYFFHQVDVYGFRSTSMVFFALYLVMAAVDGAELAASSVRRRRSKWDGGQFKLACLYKVTFHCFSLPGGRDTRGSTDRHD